MNAFSGTLLLLLAFTSTAWSDDVPVLIWTSEGSSVSFPPPLAGHRLSSDAFTRDYLDRILEVNVINNVALFIEDQLSIEYLRDGANEDNIRDDDDVTYYENLKSAMDKSSGVVLPAVSSAVAELHSTIIKYWTGPVYQLKGPSYSLPISRIPDSGVTNDQDLPSLFIVTMPTSPEQLNTSSLESDSVIDAITSQLETLGRPFISLYTAHHSPMGKSFDTERPLVARTRRGRRHLMQQQEVEVVDGTTYLFVNVSNCLYFYVENITFTAGPNTWVLPLDPTVSDSSFCSNYSATLIMDFNVAVDLPSLTTTMTFTQTLGLNAGYWYMDSFTIDYDYVNGSSSVNETVDIWPYFITETPFGLSYSCSYLPQLPAVNVTQNGRGVNITFTQLQVQAFNISNDEFGYYNDCVGFFNITIWCVLIVLFVLTLILADGVCMMMSLETSDRIDDPKGKTITINASD